VFIRVSRDFSVALEEPHDFKRFKVVIEGKRADSAKLAAALGGVASLSPEGHAWISEAWLRGHDGATSWQEGITAMVAVAKRYGWVDEEAKTIRAHVEWPAENQAKA
jgi:hypothetical protein